MRLPVGTPFSTSSLVGGCSSVDSEIGLSVIWVAMRIGTTVALLLPEQIDAERCHRAADERTNGDAHRRSRSACQPGDGAARNAASDTGAGYSELARGSPQLVVCRRDLVCRLLHEQKDETTTRTRKTAHRPTHLRLGICSTHDYLIVPSVLCRRKQP